MQINALTGMEYQTSIYNKAKEIGKSKGDIINKTLEKMQQFKQTGCLQAGNCGRNVNIRV